MLEGAPAIVAAVDRYALADTSRAPAFVTDEVRCALTERGVGRAPFFDASALRSGGPRDRKLGLGSSAAILTASLGALELSVDPSLSDAELARRVYLPALLAHRRAQGGGSGIDVAACTYGGVLLCRPTPQGLATEPFCLPDGVTIEVWASLADASTPELVRRVRDFGQRDPVGYRTLIDGLTEAASSAASSTDARAFIDAMRHQLDLLGALGRQSGAPIVTPEVVAWHRAVQAEQAVVLPSGAGGGDIALYVGLRPTEPAQRAVAAEAGLARLEITLGARGVHAYGPSR